MVIFYRNVLIVLHLQYVCFIQSQLTGSDVDASSGENNVDLPDTTVPPKSNCEKNFAIGNLYKTLTELDERYEKVRNDYNEKTLGSHFDEDMLSNMVRRRGIAQRELSAAGGNESLIPAGLNLGGYCSVRLPKSILFIHRMKLRNNTLFKVNSLKNDFKRMTLNAELALNDLHLYGTYTRAMANGNPFILEYTPNYGEVEFLLKRVRYVMEGRYRLLNDLLMLEMIVSRVFLEDVLMKFMVQNNTVHAGRIGSDKIEQFIGRLKNDLDKWVLDYFNDYLMDYTLAEDEEFTIYEQEKTKILNYNMDRFINAMVERIKEVKATEVKIPNYSIIAANGMQFSLQSSSIVGFESLYRRSVATGAYDHEGRDMDAIVAFNNLKVRCRYEAKLVNGAPPLAGELVFSADDLNAHMSIRYSWRANLPRIKFKFTEQTQSEILSVEGPANRMLSNWKPLLERHIIAIMSKLLIDYVNNLGTLSKCDNSQLKPYSIEDTNSGLAVEIDTEDPVHHRILRRKNG